MNTAGAITREPMVSIITATYNGTRFVDRYLQGLTTQTFSDWECIVVDDGSTDQTVRLLREKTAGDARFTILEKSHDGIPAIGRSIAMSRAAGKFLAFCDQDDVWFPDKLAFQIEAFDKYPQAVLCHTDRVYVEAENLPSAFPRRAFEPTCCRIDTPGRALYDRCAITCSSVMVRRNEAVAVNGFHKGLLGVDDYHLWLKLSARGDLILIRLPLLCCTLHNANLSARSGVIERGLEKMASVMEEEKAPQFLTRLAQAQALKAKAVGCWTQSPTRAAGCLLRSFLLRRRLRTLQLLMVCSLMTVVPRESRERSWRSLLARRKAKLMDNSLLFESGRNCDTG